MATTDFGTDIRIGKVVSTQSGIPNVVTAVINRLKTPRGGLFYDPAYGEDVRMFLQASLSLPKIEEIQAKVKDQCEQDDRVTRAVVVVTSDPAPFKMKIEIKLFTEDGPFSLILSVDKITVELLNFSLVQ